MILGAVRAIFINNTSGNNFTVAGNFIGGSAPNVGGTAWTTTGTGNAYLFTGIQLNVGTTTPSNVQGNTIQNIVWTTSSTAINLPGAWSGIYVTGGNVNIGTGTGNTIGSGTGTGSISVTTAGTGGTCFGIGSSSSGTVTISNNTIGSITANGTDTSVSASLVGIEIFGGTNTISNNLVGSAGIPSAPTANLNSLNAATSSTSAAAQHVTGIFSSGSTSASITGNTVANLNNNYAGTSTAAQIRGIVTGSGVNTITGNTVRNLSTTSLNPNSVFGASVLGISQTSISAGQTVSQNVVFSLANSAIAANVWVIGIYYSGSVTTGPNLIARNLAHSLTIASTSASSRLYGMYFNTGTFTAQNNMVRVGIDASGTSTAGASLVIGITDGTTTTGRNFYHNSVHVGGTQASGLANTYAFFSAGVSNARDYRNNLFVNTRSNSGGTGKRYAVLYGGTGVNPTGLTANNNLFLASGSGGVFGNYNGADQTTLAAWQTATGVDAASLNADPQFINPTGTAATVDLHVQPSSPASNAGTPIAGVTDDFDGQSRRATIPDIGADEFMSTNASLGTLVLSSGTLSPVFVSGTTSYTASVSNETSAMTFTPTNADAGATVTVNGNSALTPVALNVGANTVTIVVTAQDGMTTGTYTVTVTRQTALETWRNTFYGTTTAGGNAANNADPYHTGVPNLAVFAVLGPSQDPARVVASLLPQPQVIGGNYVITFTQPAGVSGVIYGAEWCADLSLGSWTPIADSGSGATHTFSVPISANPRIFMRLKVTGS